MDHFKKHIALFFSLLFLSAHSQTRWKSIHWHEKPISTFEEFKEKIVKAETIEGIHFNLLNRDEFLLCKESGFDFSTFSNLKVINMYTDVLDSVYTEKILMSLSELPNLEKLQLTSKWNHSFEGFSNIKSLTLRGNTDLNNPGLSNFESVEVLLIGHGYKGNVLAESPIFQFSHLSYLQLIDFSEETFPYEELSNLINLNCLHIGNCSLRRIPKEFGELEKLGEINLSNTPILSDTLNLEWMCDLTSSEMECGYAPLFEYTSSKKNLVSVPVVEKDIIYKANVNLIIDLKIPKEDKKQIRRGKRLKRRFKSARRKLRRMNKFCERQVSINFK